MQDQMSLISGHLGGAAKALTVTYINQLSPSKCSKPPHIRRKAACLTGGPLFPVPLWAEGVRHEFREIHRPCPRFRAICAVTGRARRPPAVCPRTPPESFAR